jgi:hypothetical protein
MKNILNFKSFSLNENRSIELDLNYINQKINNEHFFNTIKKTIDSLNPRFKRFIFNYINNVDFIDIDKIIKPFPKLLKLHKKSKNNDEFIEKMKSELNPSNESFGAFLLGATAFIGLAFLCIVSLVGAGAMIFCYIDEWFDLNEPFLTFIRTLVAIVVIIFLLGFSYFNGAEAYGILRGNHGKTSDDEFYNDIKKDTTINIKIKNQKIELKLTQDKDGNYKVVQE